MTARLREILVDLLDLDRELADTDGRHTVEDWNSLAHVRIVHALETEFAVRLPDWVLTADRITVAELAKLIESA
ncbi:acyl carrier protein [Saccharothrix tamanrassetensis]|uniref:Acyl carrier protein n=1 Tax=Saccharothrix tamanrassetensis TaxID=1051531 RepID=A0A841C576_9PSEU|nr:acyl carrier protein [Saccharothrix tamanrassetensis]MBB5953682.1 acyl carrier protein [Saccharothrix tamanrassetensis]